MMVHPALSIEIFETDRLLFIYTFFVFLMFADILHPSVYIYIYIYIYLRAPMISFLFCSYLLLFLSL